MTAQNENKIMNNERWTFKPSREITMTLERLSKNGMLITVERTNPWSVQTLTLTSAEWRSLTMMIEVFVLRQAPSVHLTLGSSETQET